MSLNCKEVVTSLSGTSSGPSVRKFCLRTLCETREGDVPTGRPLDTLPPLAPPLPVSPFCGHHPAPSTPTPALSPRERHLLGSPCFHFCRQQESQDRLEAGRVSDRQSGQGKRGQCITEKLPDEKSGWGMCWKRVDSWAIPASCSSPSQGRVLPWPTEPEKHFPES